MKKPAIRKVEVVPSDTNWRKLFEDEAETLRAQLGGNILKIHHFGSTAIPNISAKPIIDILIEVKDINQIDSHNNYHLPWLVESFYTDNVQPGGTVTSSTLSPAGQGE